MPSTLVLNATEQAARRADVECALASVQLEGLEPSEAAKAFVDRYVAGLLTLEEATSAIRALHAHESGPVHVSGD